MRNSATELSRKCVSAFTFAVCTVCIAIAFSGCGKQPEATENSTEAVAPDTIKTVSLPEPLPLGDAAIVKHEFTASNSGDESKFVELPASETGVDFINKWPDHFVHGLKNSFISAGIAAGDFNNDGLVDFFAARRSDGGRLYQNLGDFKFKDVTSEFGIEITESWGSGATFVDINDDGRLDLYLCGFECPNRLLINTGDQFVDKTKEYGLEFDGASVVMTFCDYDRDGDLDAFLLTNKTQEPIPDFNVRYDKNGVPIVPEEFREARYFIKHPNGKYLTLPAGQFDHLYRNDGGKFTEVTKESQLGEHPYYGLSATWWDYNEDGWPDVYIANDFMGPDQLFRNNGPNESGTVTFTEISKESLPHTPWFSMGADSADINNDGRLDLLASDMAGSNHYRDKLSMGGMSGPDSRAWFLNWPDPPQYMRNSLYLNSGGEKFMESAFLFGVARSDWTWTVRFSDFDQDGWQDIYFTNGMSRDWFNGDVLAKSHMLNRTVGPEASDEYWFSQPVFKLENLAFRNTGKDGFKNVSAKWGLDHYGVSTGGATADFDGDGDLDLIINGFDEPLKIYRNDVASGNSLKITLAGRKSNRQGIGTRIDLKQLSDDGTESIQTRYVASNQGFMSSSEPVVHFGTGEAETISKVIVKWPSGVVQEFEDIKTNAHYVVTEPSNESPAKDTPRPKKTMFAEASTVLPENLKHQEIEYDDFFDQKLIPNKYSQLGPGVAWGDIDGDGDQDCFMGNSSGLTGKILFNENGKLSIRAMDCFRDDRNAEDMGALFFDADGDGDLDLYVVSGSVEAKADSDLYQDRLYINDGEGNFSSGTKTWLPETRTSGSCVTACDFDRDGDLDLFVGGRIVPREYPTTPNSTLLVNDGEKFSDETEKFAPELPTAGMVTSALWTDVNLDGWNDLLVTYEWGPVRVFVNKEGQLSDQTDQCELAEHLGWFNSVSGGDIDGDGDMDYVVGNFGLNTKYYASKEKPELLFYGEFDDTGKKQIVEAKYENGVCLPRRGLGCTSSAIPSVKSKLPTYHEFAMSPLDEVYSESLLEKALKLEANNLKSLVLINESTKEKVSVAVRPLPRIAQISPIFGSTLTDMDGDGHIDLVAAQNFFGPQRETGYMDGGLSMYFKGNGAGEFLPVWPSDSGINVTGDATSLTVVDINLDNRPDIMISRNDRPPLFYENKMDNGVDQATLVLKGPEKNSLAIGSQVMLKFKDGTKRIHEVHSGSGYLSQSSTEIFVHDATNLSEVTINWPDGSTNKAESLDFSENKRCVISY